MGQNISGISPVKSENTGLVNRDDGVKQICTPYDSEKPQITLIAKFDQIKKNEEEERVFSLRNRMVVFEDFVVVCSSDKYLRAYEPEEGLRFEVKHNSSFKDICKYKHGTVFTLDEGGMLVSWNIHYDFEITKRTEFQIIRPTVPLFSLFYFKKTRKVSCIVGGEGIQHDDFGKLLVLETNFSSSSVYFDEISRIVKVSPPNLPIRGVMSVCRSVTDDRRFVFISRYNAPIEKYDIEEGIFVKYFPRRHEEGASRMSTFVFKNAGERIISCNGGVDPLLVKWDLNGRATKIISAKIPRHFTPSCILVGNRKLLLNGEKMRDSVWRKCVYIGTYNTEEKKAGLFFSDFSGFDVPRNTVLARCDSFGTGMCDIAFWRGSCIGTEMKERRLVCVYDDGSIAWFKVD